MKLPETQVALLNAASATDERTVEQLARDIDEKPEAVTRAAFELESAGLLTVEEEPVEDVELTEEGSRYLDSGLPEHALYEAALAVGADEEPIDLADAVDEASLDGELVDVALANYARKGLGSIEGGNLRANPSPDVAPDDDPETVALEAIAAGPAQIDGNADGDGDTGRGGMPDEAVLDRLERRGLVRRARRTVRSVVLTDEGVDALMTGELEVAETVDRVTPELLTSGEWRDVEFASYNVAADAETLHGGKEHILRQTANRVKDVLVGMGFKEMQGPHADADFWINDCLFMPQDHPARTHWDRFPLDVPPVQALPGDLVDRVRSAHLEGVGEDGEGYHSPWDEDFARAVALRGHTTSLSMRYLSGEAVGDLDPPARYFAVEKSYRNDTLDPTHLLEFFQVEGWVMAEDLSVRDLMGTFEEFYARFGITNIQYKPHYNPYTEPSFELFVDHPETGETIELGNSGIFREEVLRPLGVECDVMAWGISLGRLLMIMYGFEDIRDIHGTLCDLELLRETEVVH